MHVNPIYSCTCMQFEKFDRYLMFLIAHFPDLCPLVPFFLFVADCGPPSQDGYTLTAGITNTFGSEATVLTTCAQGYTGQATTPKVTCGATGQWSSAEGCSPGGKLCS